MAFLLQTLIFVMRKDSDDKDRKCLFTAEFLHFAPK